MHEVTLTAVEGSPHKGEGSVHDQNNVYKVARWNMYDVSFQYLPMRCRLEVVGKLVCLQTNCGTVLLSTSTPHQLIWGQPVIWNTPNTSVQ